jgi:O-antigen ligase
LAAAFVAFGDVVAGKIAQQGLGDDNRIAAYKIILGAISDAPFSGFGYGTFADVFPLYRDRSVAVHGKWVMAHNSYLEVFQDLGVVFGAMLIAALAMLAYQTMKGATTRQSSATVPCVATAVAFLAGVHSLVDFSLQIQAVALTFAALLGAGVAQSVSSRVVVSD